MTTDGFIQEQVDQLQNGLLMMNEAIDRIAKGGEVLALAFKERAESQSDIWDMVNDHNAWIMTVDKLLQQFQQGYHEKMCHLTNKVSTLEANVTLLLNTVERMKQIQNPEVYNVG